MRVKVKESPEDAQFSEDVSYVVYGQKAQLRFVFDDKGDSYFLYELEYQAS